MLGVTSLQLARSLALDEGWLVGVLRDAAASGGVVARSGYYALAEFSPELTPDQRAFFDAAVMPDAEQPLTPVVFARVTESLRVAGVAGLPTALDMLLATGALVRVGEHLYRGEQLAAIRARLAVALRGPATVTAAQARDAIGLSRKYVVPLLEYFDATGLTVRDGDLRRAR